MMQYAKLVVVQSCGNRLEADLTKSALEAEGIQAMIQADTVGGMREHLAWSGEGFQILVREEDLIAAREALTPLTTPPVNEGDESREANSQTDNDPQPPFRRFT
jgi:hypothetical protein